jgi:hypothetical protein
VSIDMAVTGQLGRREPGHWQQPFGVSFEDVRKNPLLVTNISLHWFILVSAVVPHESSGLALPPPPSPPALPAALVPSTLGD